MSSHCFTAFMLMSLLFRNSILNYILYTRILVLLVALLMVLGSVWILIHTKVVVQFNP